MQVSIPTIGIKTFFEYFSEIRMCTIDVKLSGNLNNCDKKERSPWAWLGSYEKWNLRYYVLELGLLNFAIIIRNEKQSRFQGFSFSPGQQIERAETLGTHTLPQHFLSECFSSSLSTFVKGRKVLGTKLNKAARSKWVALTFGITLVNLSQIFLLSPDFN